MARAADGDTAFKAAIDNCDSLGCRREAERCDNRQQGLHPTLLLLAIGVTGDTPGPAAFVPKHIYLKNKDKYILTV
jgi:hypothetical protein